MEVSIIIVSFNTKKLLLDCIESILRHTKGLSYEIIVVDNASTDSSVQAVENLCRKYKQIKLIKNSKNLGFGAANNQGIKRAKGRYILLLNSDTLFRKNILSGMVSWMDKKENVGIVSCALKNKDGSLQGTGGYFPTIVRVFSWMTIQDLPFVDYLIKPFHPVHRLSPFRGESFYKRKKELDWVTGAFMLIRRQVIKDIGYFDEDFFMYTEEVDYCFRAKKSGWKIYYLPKFSIVHLGGASGREWGHVILEFEGVKLFYKKHYPAWQYPILRILLKFGALWRIFVIGALKGRVAAKVYAKAFANI